MIKNPERKKPEPIDTPERRIQVLSILTHHIGKTNAIGMGELYYKVFGVPYEHRINDTRRLRRILKNMKNDGTAAICSHCSSNGGGYYLAAADSERDDYYRHVFLNVIGRLARLGHQRRMSRQELSAQTVLLLEVYDDKKEEFAAR